MSALFYLTRMTHVSSGSVESVPKINNFTRIRWSQQTGSHVFQRNDRNMLNLPTELALNILSYLPVNSLSRLRSVCKSWNEFCILHENTIYRNAASLHTYIPSPTTMLNELESLYSQRAMEDVKTWKDLCMCFNENGAYSDSDKGFQVGSASRYNAIGKERDHPLSLSTSQRHSLLT